MAITLQDKLGISAEQAAMYWLLSLPVTFALTNRLLLNVRTVQGGVPTPAGLVVHAAVFGALTFAGMFVPTHLRMWALVALVAVALVASADAFGNVASSHLRVWALVALVAVALAANADWLTDRFSALNA